MSSQLIDAVEHRIMGTARKQPELPVGFDVQDQSSPQSESFFNNDVVRFQIRFSALDYLPAGYGEEEVQMAKEKIVRMYEREIYKEVRDECHRPLYDLKQRALANLDVESALIVDRLYSIIYRRQP